MLCLSLHGLARGQTTYNYRYWFDCDVSTLQSGSQTDNSWHWDIPVNGFSDWLHLFHLQIQDAEGKWSVTRTMPFVIVATDLIETSRSVIGGRYRYWFDGKVETLQEGPITANAWRIEIPMTDMDEWFHIIQFQVADSDGKWSPVHTKSFAIVPESLMQLDGVQDVTGGRYRYWFDGDSSTLQEGVMTSNLLKLDIPITGFSDWLHQIHFQVQGTDGKWSSTHTKFFAVLPAESHQIARYAYWVNEPAISFQSQELQIPQDEFSIISLLPVEAQPIRSKKFQFSVKEGLPIIYAKNDFHALFIDGSGRQVTEEREYVDEQVSAEVEPVGELQPTQAFDKVADNTIRWYTVNAEAGDSLAFKASHATTIQLFSPSGEELYTAQGPTSVVYGGCHTWESGTHYLAVHDVMGSKPTMTIDYLHMDKYDVVDWDVHVVGNGGYNSILFKGNGFHDLRSVDLALGTSIITSDSIGHESDAETTVRFDFDGAELGEYKAIFHFADDDLEVENCLTVEEATEIELDADVFFANTFLFGRGNTYTFQYHNNSNMTAYDVPFAVYIFTPEHLNDSIFDPHTYIKVGGYDLEKHYKELLGEYYTDSLNAIIQAKRQLTGDTYYLLDDTIPDYLSGYPYARHTFIQTTLHPNETKTFTIHVNIMTDMYVYIYSPTNWNITERVVNQGSNIQAIRRKVSEKVHCTPSDWVKANECAQRDLLDGKEVHKNMGKIDCEKLPLECRPKHGGHGKGRGPGDPNEIYGYFTETGSKFIADTVDKVNYTIEFENDTTFATASAHTIVIRDTLDNSYFNMYAFMPTKVRIGNHDLFLTDNDISTSDNVTSFVKTIDMRPEIYAIAQVEGTYDMACGIAEWRFSSLDPMTMEPTDDIMQGILPVNYDGTSGIGEVMFEIGVKANKGDGAQIANRAGIVFDYEEAILTPTWVNTVDAVAPTSTILGGIQTNDSTLTLRLAGEDARSGVWKYNVYAQFGAGTSWELVAENVTDTLCDVRIYEDIDYSFCVLATDSAGNVEKKVFSPEFSLSSDLLGDANGDGNIDLTDVVMITYHSLGTAQPNLNLNAADVNRDGVVDLTDAIIVVYRSLGTESGGAGQGSGAEPE